MKNRKIILTIISILITLSSGVIFFLPTWYFTYTTTSNETTSLLTNKYINLLEFDALKQVENMYSNLSLELPSIFSSVFIILVGLTLLSSLIMIIINMISLFKSLSPKITKLFPVISIILSILTITVALIFAHKSTQTNSENILTINITIGVYLFTILQVSGNACAYITNNLKEI